MRMFLFVTTTTNCNRFLMISTHLFNLYYPCRGFCWYHPPILQVAIKSNQHNFSITFSILGNITIKSVKEFTNTINIYQGWSVNNREVTVNAASKYRRILKIQKKRDLIAHSPCPQFRTNRPTRVNIKEIIDNYIYHCKTHTV